MLSTIFRLTSEPWVYVLGLYTFILLSHNLYESNCVDKLFLINNISIVIVSLITVYINNIHLIFIFFFKVHSYCKLLVLSNNIGYI